MEIPADVRETHEDHAAELDAEDTCLAGFADLEGTEETLAEALRENTNQPDDADS